MTHTPSSPSLPSTTARLFDSLPAGFALVDGDGRIVHLNPAAARLLGEEDAEACRHLELQELFPDLPPGLRVPDGVDDADVRGIVWPRHRPRVEGAVEWRACPGDAWLPGAVLVSLTPAADEAEALDAGAVRRLTRAERALEDGRRYLTMVTHELRTPLGAILGLAGTLDGTELSTDQRQLVHTLEASARGMSHLLDGIFDLARMQVGALEPTEDEFSLPDVVESVASALAGQAAQKHLEVSVEVDPAVPWLSVGDPRAVRQLLLNLGANAVTFTDRGGVHLSVRVGRALEWGGVEMILEVRDTGPGIAPELHERIFDPFVQGPDAPRDEGGAGLGLAVVRGLVQRLGGRIELESSRGHGSCFRVVLPHGSTPRACPNRRQSDRTWPDTAVLAVGGTGTTHAGIAAAVAHMGSRVDFVSPDRLLDRVRPVEVPRLVVLLDHALGREQVGRLAAAARAAGASDVDVDAVVLVPPGSDAWLDAAGHPLPYLLKPVLRRRLAAYLSPEPAVVAAPALDGPRRVLVVEDDRGIRVVLKRFLPRIFDAEVTEAGSVADALTKLDGAPHLALLDLGLPDGDGAEVARALRERYGREVLLVATSGYDGSRVHPLLRDGTFDAFLPKPASLGQIETLLNNLFSRSPTRSEALALTRQ